MRGMLLFVALLLAAGSSQAATYNVNLDATQHIGLGDDTANYLGVQLSAGDYKITGVNSPYLAYRFNTQPVTGCDLNGENCDDSGFVWNYAVATAAGGNILDVYAGNPFATATAAFAAALALGPQFFTLANDDEVLFGIQDFSTSGFDNSGGVSLLVETVGGVQVVPLPATGMLLGSGLGFLAGWRRRMNRSKQA